MKSNIEGFVYCEAFIILKWNEIVLLTNASEISLIPAMFQNYEFPDDNETGFSIAELKGVLRKTFNIADLKKNVKALRTDPTILSNIDKLFETYEKAK